MASCVESAFCVSGYIIHLKFGDRTEADVDLEIEVWGEVFEPAGSSYRS